MDGVRQCVSDASDRTKVFVRVRKWRLRSQVLKGVAFLAIGYDSGSSTSPIIQRSLPESPQLDRRPVRRRVRL